MKQEGYVPPQSQLTMNQAVKYLSISSTDLSYIDIAYNVDTEESVEYKRTTLPTAMFMIERDSIVILVYSIEFNYDYSDDYVYDCYLAILNRDGMLLDKRQISRNHWSEYEEFQTDFVIINDSTYKIFSYEINENSMKKNEHGIYDVIDDKAPLTKVSIVEYNISNNGQILESNKKDTEYLEKPVQWYKEYHEDSDDPMNEYK